MFFASLASAFFVFLLATLAVCYVYFKSKLRYYWKEHNVPYAEPYFLFGSCPGVNIRYSFGDAIKGFYDKYKASKLYGFWIYTKPGIVINDVDLIKTILVKDFKYFHDRGIHFDENHEPLLASLFFLNGSKWRNMRVKLAPTFTSGKMKMMYQTMLDCSDALQEYLTPFAATSAVVDMKETLAAFTTDIIGSCAFGLETKTIGNPNSEFRKYGKMIIDLPFINLIGGIFNTLAPNLSIKLGLKQTPEAVTTFFTKLFKDTVEYRQQNNIKRNDFLQLLIELINKGYIEDADTKFDKDSANVGDEFTLLQATAQAFVFFMAGFETSSTTMMLALYELSLQPDLQEKVHNEISTVLKKHNEKFTYEAIQQMTYLDQLIQESLRKYPVVPVLMRECNEDYKVPDMDVTIPKGTMTVISVTGLHHDPALFPDPQKFDPERFAPGNENFTLSFGDGPRICIGSRFGILQAKTGLAILLKKYRFEVTQETPIPPKFKLWSFIPVLTTGMYLRIKIRE